jgi:hypothetical protein
LAAYVSQRLTARRRALLITLSRRDSHLMSDRTPRRRRDGYSSCCLFRFGPAVKL